ncbi:MAG TPA: hypothetical protein VG675_17990 [Bryobacteraceae bacterium]|nr:hypothetical protein [Bryobacteraceae bacterium]
MLTYPQLSSGAITHFPVRKRRVTRTITNTTLDGRAIKLADPGAETTQWQLQYSALSDEELSMLQQFFSAAEGTLNTFLFLDPTDNLLAWSGQLDQAVWECAPFLSLSSDISDLAGGTAAWTLTNSSSAAQSIQQTLNAPAGYVYCFSAYARCNQPVTVTMLRGTDRFDRAVGPGWSRLVVSGASAPADSISFGLELPGNATIDVYGLQVEPQTFPSAYKPTQATTGVYADARLRDDLFSFTTTDVNRHSCAVNIIHANHL